MFHYILAWFPMLVIAILNGAARDFLYKEKLGDMKAHQVSTITGIVIFTFYVYLIDWLWPFTSASQSLLVGTLWVLMTIIFEFGFGHYIMKNPWKKLLYDYNILEGRIWSLFLLFLFLIPWTIYIINE